MTNTLSRQKLYLCQLSPVIDDEVQRAERPGGGGGRENSKIIFPWIVV